MGLADLRSGVPIGFEMWISLGNLAEVIVATLGIHYLFKGAPHLSSVKALARYSVFAVILVPFVTAFVGANASEPYGYWVQWRLWFFADALAFFTVTPAILSWVREGRVWARKSHNLLELAALMTSLVFFGYLTFMGTGRQQSPALLYSLVPLLLWAALRLGLKGVATSMVVVALLSIWGAAYDRGPFTGQGPLNNALSIQLFLFFAAISFMVLAVLVEEQKRAEEALRESEARLRLAVRAGRMYAFEWNTATDVIIRSEELTQILSLVGEPTNLTKQQLLARVHPADLATFNTTITKCTPDSPDHQISFRLLRPDGSVVWLERTGHAFFDEQGKMVRMIGMVADVTERKVTESELALANDRLRLAMESGKSVGWDRDVKSGRDILFGDLQILFGMPLEKHVGNVEDFYRCVHPEDRERIWRAVNDAMESRKLYAAEFRTLWPDGTVRWMSAKGKFYYSPDGEPERMLGMAVDITERKLVEMALHESEERLRLAAQAGKMYAIEWDAATDVVIRSEEAAHILGLIGEPVRLTHEQMLLGCVHPEDRAIFNTSIAELTPESPNSQISFRSLRPDGSVVWLERTGHAFFDEQGKMVRMIGMVADVTERKLMEAALRESEGRFRLVADTAPVMIWMSDVNKLCTYINQGWLEFTGRSSEAELASSWAE